MEDKIKIAVLGCANIAKRMVIPAIKQNARFELAHVSSRQEHKAKKFAEMFGCNYLSSYEETLQSDVDAVYVPLPTGLHYDWAIQLIKSGKHVLIEKSLASTYPEVKKIIKCAEDHNRLVMENFQFLFHSQHESIKNMIDQGDIGDIRCFRSSFGFPPFRDPANIRYSKTLGGGALLDAGAYTLKAPTFIVGSGFKVAAANMHFDKGFDVDISGEGMLVHPNGTTAQIAYGFDHFLSV